MTNNTQNDLEITVVIPVSTRHDDMLEIHSAYKAALDKYGKSYQFIYVLDGHFPDVAADLKQLSEKEDNLELIRLTKTFGEATALSAGFDHAKGKNILTLPAYFQIEPDEVSKLLDALDDYDMVISHRWPRAGNTFERYRRSIFHGLLRKITHISFRDLGCNARAMKREVVEETPIYGDQHRFFPILAHHRGFQIKELDVAQSPKDRHIGHYRIREYLHRMLDILTVFFLVRFTKKPLRFFGMIGTITSVTGGLILSYGVFERLIFGVALGTRPLLLLSSLLVVLGIQILALGLVGELIIFIHARKLREYHIKEIVNKDE